MGACGCTCVLGRCLCRIEFLRARFCANYQWPTQTSQKNLFLSCRVVELTFEVLSTTLSQVLDSLPPVLMTPATLPPNWLGFFMRESFWLLCRQPEYRTIHPAKDNRTSLPARRQVSPEGSTPGMFSLPCALCHKSGCGAENPGSIFNARHVEAR